jgi:hypothetical protein
MAVDLGGITLEHLTDVAVTERTRLVRHAPPGLDGDLAQVLGRPSIEVHFRGIFYGLTAADDLHRLRQIAADHKPVDFFTEAVGEGFFSQVLITEIEVAQRAGYLDQFDFSCTVVEYVVPPEPAVTAPLDALDTDLLGEAVSFMDDVQNALGAVSELTDLIGSIPSFGNPTERLHALLDGFSGVLGRGSSGRGTLTDLGGRF